MNTPVAETAAPAAPEITVPRESVTAPEALPRVLELAEQASGSVAIAADYAVIESAAMYEAAGEDLRDVKAKQKALAALRAHLLDPLNAHVKRMREFFAVPEQRLADAESTIKRGMLAYDDRIARERAEAQRKAREEEERLARIERERLAEEQRKADEARRAAEEKLDAAPDASARTEALRELHETELREQRLQDEQFAASARPTTSHAAVGPTAPKATGVAKRENWKAEPEEDGLAKMVAAAFRDPQFLAYLSFNGPALNQAARALKGHANLPGVRVYCERSIAAGSR